MTAKYTWLHRQTSRRRFYRTYGFRRMPKHERELYKFGYFGTRRFNNSKQHIDEAEVADLPLCSLLMPEKETISCVCMTCGIRNDHSRPDGFCQNGHDDWLEYRDVMLIDGADHTPLARALRITRMKLPEFRRAFLNNSIKQFPIFKDSWIRRANALGKYEMSHRGFRIYTITEPKVKRSIVDREGEQWMRIEFIKGHFLAIDKTGAMLTGSGIDSLIFDINIETLRRPYK